MDNNGTPVTIRTATDASGKKQQKVRNDFWLWIILIVAASGVGFAIWRQTLLDLELNIPVETRTGEKKLLFDPFVAPETVDYPKDYPKELMFEIVRLDEAATAPLPGGRTQMTLQYNSANPPASVTSVYIERLEAGKWTVTGGKDREVPDKITAVKGQEEVEIALVPGASTTAVSIKYIK